MTTVNKVKEPKPITGWTVLYWILGFFAVIFLANAIFIYLALGSFPGVEVDSAYKAGQHYDDDLAQARAQDELGWSVDVSFDRTSNGRGSLSIKTADKAGKPLSDLQGTAILKHPTTEIADKPIELTAAGNGELSGIAEDVAPGNWILELTLTDKTGNQFKSRNKLFVREQ
ncbi:FixH family protein [Coralliovum pocilloporae]|uniref:FixH family protein n=1 Tax=Coralliovum pocilloporae TaxID=3066369 RepID=UPI003306E97C